MKKLTLIFAAMLALNRCKRQAYQTKSKETCIQSNRAIGTSQRLSISDFCEFLQKSEIESFFLVLIDNLLYFCKKISETTNVKLII